MRHNLGRSAIPIFQGCTYIEPIIPCTITTHHVFMRPCPPRVSSPDHPNQRRPVFMRASPRCYSLASRAIRSRNAEPHRNAESEARLEARDKSNEESLARCLCFWVQIYHYTVLCSSGLGWVLPSTASPPTRRHTQPSCKLQGFDAARSQTPPARTDLSIRGFRYRLWGLAAQLCTSP